MLFGSFCVFLLCLPTARPCSGDRYLAILRQEHGLGVTEGLPDIMLGIRVMGARDCSAQRHRVQGVGGDGALHALHGQLEEGCAGERRKVEQTKRGANADLLHAKQRQQRNNHGRTENRGAFNILLLCKSAASKQINPTNTKLKNEA